MLGITITGVALISMIFIMKFKPSYKVSISGEEVGYIESKKAFEKELENTIINTNEKKENIDSISYNTKPEYKLSFISRSEKSNEEQIANELKQDADVTYKYYEIAVSNVPVETVDTLEEAQELVKEVKDEENSQEIDLSIVEKYTNNVEEINTDEIEVAKVNVTGKVAEQLVAEQKAKEEQERINAMPIVNGIRLAYMPVTVGQISSRYGESSSLRSQAHTGLDIACPTGTPIKVTSDGTVISASYSGSYGNLIKVDHGNGLQTWYAHTSKMYVQPGQLVKAGEVIGAVGSTGNSTGAHLHLEIRINGQAINPQKYLYN